MSQHITIRNFGPIKEVSIEVKDILIFIGAQASGKSTIGKAIFFFKSLGDDLINYLEQSYQKKQFDDHVNINEFAKVVTNKFIRIYGSVSNFPNMYLEYRYGNGVEIFIKFVSEHNSINIIFNKIFLEKSSNITDQWKQVFNEKNNSKFLSSKELQMVNFKLAALFHNMSYEVSSLFNDHPAYGERDFLFIPAGRSLVTTLSKQIYNIDLEDSFLSNSNFIKLDYFVREFIRRSNDVKPLFEKDSLDSIFKEVIEKYDSNLQRVIQLAKDLVKLILKGSYRYQNGLERIDLDNGQSIPINLASSGQQEVIWILLFVYLLIIHEYQVCLVFEEPEANLFPIAQKEIIDLIALLANQNQNQIILTTHSPYILSSFNNLLYAYILGNNKPEEVDRVVSRHFWLDPNRLDAYILEDGTARSIMDTETGLINSGEIDRASDIIVDTFNQLFELEDEE
jgi:predicted ATPase